MVSTVSVQISVSFYTTRVFFGAGESGFPTSVAVLQRTAIALSEVEHIVIAVYGKQSGYVYRASEELDGIIGTVSNINVFNHRSVSYCIQCKSVVLDIGTRTRSGIKQLDITQHARIVGIVIASVGLVVINLGSTFGYSSLYA